ncbi:ABC transporter permease [Arthrospiribacter ruber]|uniref:ABC transporter permease n=1 Tax=Arthrospiribacter ruber TaxID=2487934 RepID=A0A951J1W4_9BACT|nr:ABC transporter permease [Arthrospiribacter ruber]MBW3466824.1 ABC transporter permease [Arthrospiribacter ruber]MBW3469616.1 ABC transporter permease [Arthrospiribacter ruber]MBW3470309.1 ABC transporter permease [Arthrospiribacter ruber]
MLKSYFKIACRNLLKHKIFSAINFLGLTVGVTSFLIIFQYVNYELSYDRFHENADRIYRVQHDRYFDGELQYQKAQTFIPTGEAMMNEFVEVEAYTTLFRISAESDITMRHKTEKGELVSFSEEEVYHAKGDFFKIFTLPIIEGQKEIKSIPEKSVLISKSVASRYFGEESAVGKFISHNYVEDHEIIGVFEDFPSNSHVSMDFIFAWQKVTDEANGGDENNWRWDGFYTYLLLHPGSDPGTLENKFPGLVEKYKSGQLNEQVSSVLSLQPLPDIHLKSNLLAELKPNGDQKIVFTLLALAIFVLLIAWINFINLSTSRSFERFKEIGIRKVIGSGKKEIFFQFLLESCLLNFISVLTAFLLISLFNPIISPLLGIDLVNSFLNKAGFWTILLFMIMLGGVAASIYPARIMSSFRPAIILKGNQSRVPGNTSSIIRYGLVVFQFVISISLIGASSMAYKQLSFMKDKSLGLNIENTLVINTKATFGPPGSDSVFLDNLNTFRNSLRNYESIAAVTASFEIPGKEHQSIIPHFRHSKNKEELAALYLTRVDFDFIPALSVNLLAGRNFIEGKDNQSTLILNMEAIKTLGYESPDEALGQEVIWGNQAQNKAKIIGVVDLRATAYKKENYPIAYTPTFFPFRYATIKFAESNNFTENQMIQMAKNAWMSNFPDIPFDYFFLDELFENHYKSDHDFGLVLALFTGLAILVACSGLFAIATLTVEQRTKEVGLRKVMGASTSQLLVLLSKNFLLLILIAGLISVPIIKTVLEIWLENYPYKAAISWWIYLLPIGLIVLVSALTIGGNILKASLVNPVKLLKYE